MSDQRINLAGVRAAIDPVVELPGDVVLALVEAVEAAANLPWMEMSDELETALARFDFGERPEAERARRAEEDHRWRS